ncbi:hypothetical protein B0T25DRAFT_618531 [Lasiosphaeria hispida]|uniref:Uncharacterized protein n=1 Tax=Lasiosphaeria hispida TaxID=260671 RepID=A0AAJ0H5C3_9PEZI|nr:hypothetical protein B0T25DRAFT_618531 [Lasiosphaeria hispida]
MMAVTVYPESPLTSTGEKEDGLIEQDTEKKVLDFEEKREYGPIKLSPTLREISRSATSTSLGPRPNNGFRSLRAALGILGSVTILLGSLIVFGVLGFLIFLWTGEGHGGSERASSSWRWFVIGERITQAITLSTVVIRFIIVGQATICTSLIAAVILERHGIPLSKLAEVSIFRSINDGPYRLSWVLITNAFSKKSILPTLLITILVFGDIATQFLSTILVTDLQLDLLVGDPVNETVMLEMSNSFSGSIYPHNTFSRQPTYAPFGENNVSAISPLPNEKGLSDTGIMQRVFVPVKETNRTSLRSYEGKSYAMNSRFVCVPPVLEKPQITVVPGPKEVSIANGYFISAGIDMAATLAGAGLKFPPDCEGGRCFAGSSAFNCSLPWVEKVAYGIPTALCLPDGSNAYWPDPSWAINDQSLSNRSEILLVVRSNTTNLDFTTPGTTPLPENHVSSEAEWKIYPSLNNSAAIELSLCFQQIDFDFVTAHLTTPTDLEAPIPGWAASTYDWNMTQIQAFLGTAPSASRGIYTIASLSSPLKTHTTWDLTARLVTHVYMASADALQNVTLFMCPKAGGFQTVLADMSLQALFADTLAATDRPALALQSLMTAMASSAVSEALKQFDVPWTVTTASSVLALHPRGVRGLVAAVVIVVVDILVAGLIVSLFLRQSRFSAQGDYWHAVGQMAGRGSRPMVGWIIDAAGRMTDGEVERLLRASEEDFVVGVGQVGAANGGVEVGVRRFG